jgi:hypothetical protein
MESAMVKFEEVFLHLLGGAEDKYEELECGREPVIAPIRRRA